MFVSGQEEAAEPAAATVPATTAATDAHLWLSPSIQQVVGEKIGAFELKFLVPLAIASQIEAWATEMMQPDAFADPVLGGAYRTTTLYLDTPARDVLHRSPGHCSRKFRVRRYGMEATVHLERKTRRGDQVKKRRSQLPLEQITALFAASSNVAGSNEWFRSAVAEKSLQPTCLVTYDRTAFVKRVNDDLLRLTLDRQIRGRFANQWMLSPIEEGNTLLPQHAVCEFKFRGALPNLFKELIGRLNLAAGSCSKYRRTMQMSGEPGHA